MLIVKVGLFVVLKTVAKVGMFTTAAPLLSSVSEPLRFAGAIWANPLGLLVLVRPQGSVIPWSEAAAPLVATVKSSVAPSLMVEYKGVAVCVAWVTVTLSVCPSTLSVRVPLGPFITFAKVGTVSVPTPLFMVIAPLPVATCRAAPVSVNV